MLLVKYLFLTAVECTLLILVNGGDSWNGSFGIKPQGSVGTGIQQNSGTGIQQNSDLPSCSTGDQQLLTNLYVDYFETSGSCLDKDGEILRTYESSRKDGQFSEEEIKMAEEFCKNSPILCQQEGRSGRLFLGLGKKIASNFQRKVNQILDLFTGTTSNYGHQHSAPFSFSDAFNPPQNPWHPPHPQSPPYVPPVAPYSQPPGVQPPIQPPFAIPFVNPPSTHNSGPSHAPPFNLYSLLSSIMAYQPPPIQQTRFGNTIQQAYDSPCGKDNCPPGSVDYPSPPSTNNPARYMRNKRSSCPIYGDVLFPMVAKSALDNSTINILQDFPHLVQPVFFRKCRSKNPVNSKGNCVQEFLPMNFFTSNYGHKSRSGPLLPQEFVLVESGCRIEPESSSTSNRNSFRSTKPIRFY